MFDWQSFADHNNLLIGLVVGSAVFISGTIWMIKYYNRDSKPERILGRSISAKAVRIVLILGFLGLSVQSVFAWRSAVIFWSVFCLITLFKRQIRRQMAKASSAPDAP